MQQVFTLSTSIASAVAAVMVHFPPRVDCRVGVAVGTAARLADVMVCDTQMMHCGWQNVRCISLYILLATACHLDISQCLYCTVCCPDLSLQSHCHCRSLRLYILVAFCLSVCLSVLCKFRTKCHKQFRSGVKVSSNDTSSA